MRVRSPRALRIALVLASAVLISAVSLSCLGSKPAVQATDPKGPARLAWGEPLVIRWNQELQDIQLQVTPEAEVRSELRDGGRAAYVVGDSRSFKMVHIETARILGEIATEVGFLVLGIELWRDRRSTAHQEPLPENVLLLRKP